MLGRAHGDELAATHAGARTQVDDVVGVPNRVLVVLDNNKCVAGSGQRVERGEQHGIVARVQADGRLIEYVAHALQVGAQLRSQSDALRLAARERRRGAIERQVAQADARQKLQAIADFRHRIQRYRRAPRVEAQPRAEFLERIDGKGGQIADRPAIEAQMPRNRVEARALAGRTRARGRRIGGQPLRLLAGLLVREVARRDSRAVAFNAPALRRVEGQQARIGLGKTTPTARAGAAA